MLSFRLLVATGAATLLAFDALLGATPCGFP
jgi:hypothetical protein